MFEQNPTAKILALVAAIGLTAGGVARCVRTSLSHGGRQDGQSSQTRAVPVQAAHAAQHGGQVSQTANYCFEVVYRPQEARVYLYNHDHRHLSVRGVTGQASLRLAGNDKVFRLPIQYSAGRSPRQHDYLAVYADFNGVRDRGMKVTMALANLPDLRQRSASFVQTFSISAPSVSIAPLTGADRAGMARQQTCVVTDTKLGSHGTPIKSLVREQPVFLCCGGCLRKLKEEPQKYLTRIVPPAAAEIGDEAIVAGAAQPRRGVRF